MKPAAEILPTLPAQKVEARIKLDELMRRNVFPTKATLTRLFVTRRGSRTHRGGLRTEPVLELLSRSPGKAAPREEPWPSWNRKRTLHRSLCSRRKNHPVSSTDPRYRDQTAGGKRQILPTPETAVRGQNNVLKNRAVQAKSDQKSPYWSRKVADKVGGDSL